VPKKKENSRNSFKGPRSDVTQPRAPIWKNWQMVHQRERGPKARLQTKKTRPMRKGKCVSTAIARIVVRGHGLLAIEGGGARLGLGIKKRNGNEKKGN